MKCKAIGMLGFAVVAAGCADVPTSPAESAQSPRASLIAAAALSTVSVNFENPPYSLGAIHLQDGWSSLGTVGSGCANYDHRVAPNTPGVAGFGAQSLRMSNAVTSGCFSDQTFSKEVATGAGESTAQDIAGSTSSARNGSFEAQWQFASALPGVEQVGLSVVASPDRGDGARMSWIQMTDTPGGLQVNFNDFQKALGDFVLTPVATGLDRTVSHTIKVVMQFVEGPANDVVKVYVDGVLRHTGTSWEDYFRDVELNPTRTVSRLLFRTGGAAAPAHLGNGFLIDNLSIMTYASPPSTVDQCKLGGWQAYSNPAFKNQGDCIQFVNTNK